MFNRLRNRLRKWLGIEVIARDAHLSAAYLGLDDQHSVVGETVVMDQLKNLNTAIVEQGKSFDKRCEQLAERIRRTETMLDLTDVSPPPTTREELELHMTGLIGDRALLVIDGGLSAKITALESRNNSAASLVKELNGKAPKKSRTRVKKGR